MAKTIRVESNDESALMFASKFLARYQDGITAEPEFCWKLFCEAQRRPESTEVSAFSGGGLRYVNIGQNGFLATDLEQREGIAFLPKMFFEVDSDPRYRPPLDLLVCMTAANLGKVAFSGACIAVGGKAVLIFGPPDSGKTTAAYLAAKTGLEFHADQVIFADTRSEPLSIWGDVLPAVFRPASVEYMPELASTVRRVVYNGIAFCYYDKSRMQPERMRAVTPVGSVFLERGSNCETAIRQLRSGETISQLRDFLLYQEDERFDAQVQSAIDSLCCLPAFHLQYDRNPNIAAEKILDLLV